MALLAPLYFYLALAGAAVVVALHCIVTRQPASAPFPTVRFVPVGSAMVTAFSRPEHLILLLVRVLAILAVGLAFAHPVLLPRPIPLRRIVLLDRSGMADLAEVRDSARSILRPGDLLIPFDSGAAGPSAESGSIDRLTRGARQGRLTPALIAALRTASRLRRSTDSLELVIISPLLDRETDGATPAVRALWPGRIRLVEVTAVTDSARGRSVEIQADSLDGVRIAAELAGLAGGATTTRLLRRPMSIADSVWASQPGHTVIRWDSIPGAAWASRIPADTGRAVVADGAVLVYPLARKWRATLLPGYRVVARWVDGEPAAIEYDSDAGCIREVAIPVPTRGDIVLRLPFRRLVTALLAPCHAAAAGPIISADTRRLLEGQGGLAPGLAFAAPAAATIPPLLWPLLLALLLLALEQWLRPRAGGLTLPRPEANR